MKACSRIIFREYTRWNWHRFIKMVAVASKGQSLRHSWWKSYVIQSTKPIEWIVLFMRRKVNRVLRTAVRDTALLPCRKDLCDGEMPAALRQILRMSAPSWGRTPIMYRAFPEWWQGRVWKRLLPHRSLVSRSRPFRPFSFRFSFCTTLPLML